MADFIEREALKADLQESYEGLKNIYKVLKHDEERRICEAQLAVITEAILRVKDAPAADVVEVRHGRWEWYDLTISFHYINRGYRCSVCGHKEDDEPNYCPHCGAKMDKEE